MLSKASQASGPSMLREPADAPEWFGSTRRRSAAPNGDRWCARDRERGEQRATVATNTRWNFLRAMPWSEQARLRWCDADLLTGTLTIPQSKNGRTRHIPMNAVVRSLLIDIGARRQRLGDPAELLFAAAYRTTARALEKAVIAAQAAIASTGQDPSRLDGFTWHGLRHTWASRLVMAGVDLRTLQQLGSWRTPMMVERYSHLSPDHLRAAMETLVATSAVPALRSGAAELERNLNETHSRRGASIQNGVEVCDSMSTEG